VKERSRNKLKDFLTMAPVLQVTHLLAFTLTDIAPSLRILRLSNGPTLSFRIERYSLMKDIIASSRHAKYLSPIESKSAPLVRPPVFSSSHSSSFTKQKTKSSFSRRSLHQGHPPHRT
jgi:hypothetical protein